MTEPHEWYGPCDGMGPDGKCSECGKAMFATEEEWLRWLRGTYPPDQICESCARPFKEHVCGEVPSGLFLGKREYFCRGTTFTPPSETGKDERRIPKDFMASYRGIDGPNPGAVLDTETGKDTP